jgi:acetoin utilization deacetylase AcuC-like enzyme
VKITVCDHVDFPLPAGHRFPGDKYARLRQAVLRAHGAQVEILEAEPAAREQLLLAHDKGYCDRFMKGALSTRAQRRIGFPWSPQLVQRSLCSVGATVQAAEWAVRDGLAMTLSGGTHHASFDRGEGYCVFNDAVIAARQLQRAAGIERVAIVDCDVHQGNGTAALTRQDERIFAFSIHGEQNFPFAKVAGDLDIGLPSGTTDDEYLQALSIGLSKAIDRFEPQHVIYLAGADPWIGDRLGKLSISKSGLRRRDELVFTRCEAGSIPVTVAMAGGYAPLIADTVEIHLATVESALDSRDRRRALQERVQHG